jgi:GNAT superfamily N-acetyltransferase
MSVASLYEVRAGRADDLPLYRETIYRALRWDPSRVLPPLEHMMVHPEIVRYHANWGRPGDLAAVAEWSGVLVGAAFCRLFTADDHGDGFVDDETPELVVALDDDHRGRGVGSLLLSALETDALGVGVLQLSLSVEAANPAHRLYARLGYQIVSRDHRDLLMLKRL